MVTGGLSADLQLDMYEQAGGDSLELSVTAGQKSFSTSTFSLLQDGVLGWAVKDPTSTPPPNYRALIGTNVQAEMYYKASTAYVRVPFTVGDTGDFDAARFQIKYDDGFVAYVNGTELARRNAPATPDWSSAATAAHPDADAVNYTAERCPRYRP